MHISNVSFYFFFVKTNFGKALLKYGFESPATLLAKRGILIDVLITYVNPQKFSALKRLQWSRKKQNCKTSPSIHCTKPQVHTHLVQITQVGIRRFTKSREVLTQVDNYKEISLKTHTTQQKLSHNRQRHNTKDRTDVTLFIYAASANPTCSLPKSKTVWYLPINTSPSILPKFKNQILDVSNIVKTLIVGLP